MKNRFYTLDGWRGISILLVMAGHLLPLGLKSWQMNAAVAGSGMAIFFILSGFLITNLLLKNQDIFSFLVRRFMRIIPLAWLIVLLTFFFTHTSTKLLLSHLFFYANWKPIAFMPGLGHFWSLCVEMQFYILIALLVNLLKSRAFLLLPIFSLAITGYRCLNGVEMTINTYYRIDEILAGCILALLFNLNSQTIKSCSRFLSPIYLFPLLLLSAHPDGGWLNYIRPYIAMLVVGASLFNSKKQVWWNDLLKSKILFYIGSISYALYLIHGGLSHTWLSEGNTIVKYLKRPLLLGITFLLAHISTFYYEKHWIKLGKKLTKKPQKVVQPSY